MMGLMMVKLIISNCEMMGEFMLIHDGSNWWLMVDSSLNIKWLDG